jgi:hypothetical protein
MSDHPNDLNARCDLLGVDLADDLNDIRCAYFIQLSKASSCDPEIIETLRHAHNKLVTHKEREDPRLIEVPKHIKQDIDEARSLISAITGFFSQGQSVDFILTQFESVLSLPHWQGADLQKKFQEELVAHYQDFHFSSGSHLEMSLHQSH